MAEKNIESGNNEGVIQFDPGSGLLVCKDAASGEIIWREDKGRGVKVRSSGYTLSSQTIEFTDDKGFLRKIPYNPSLLAKRNMLWPYLENIGLEIARRISEGETLKAICSTDGFPPLYIVGKWKAEVPGFKAMLNEARKMRAEVYHDDIVNEIENCDEDTAKSSKVRIDGYKYLAGIDNPEEFSQNPKGGEFSAPSLTFIFNTGINRGDDNDDAIEVESKVIDEEKD